MVLKDGHRTRNWFAATEILRVAVDHREDMRNPKAIQTWLFLRKYVAESDKLDWVSEPECRATTRDIAVAADACGIAGTITSLECWEALVIMMNMP